MHTAEHILNQTMDKVFKCGRCFSAHIEKKKSKCDYRFDRDLTEAEADNINYRVNSVINENLNVREEFVNREAAEKKYNLLRLPEHVKDDIRIIKVGDYDACPCIGEHVKSTKELGEFKIISHSFLDGVLRVRFKLLAR